MLEKEQMERLNFLARKSKQESLSLEESKEQKKLRAEYILKFKAHFKAHLDSIEFVDDDPMKKK